MSFSQFDKIDREFGKSNKVILVLYKINEVNWLLEK